MNVREIISLIGRVYPDLKLEYNYNWTAKEGTYKNFISTKGAIRTLRFHDFLPERTEPLWNAFFSEDRADEGKIDIQHNSALNNHYSILFNVVKAFSNYLDYSSISNTENSVRIKIPNELDFQELSKISNDLNRSFSIPLAKEEINGFTRIKSIENGSTVLIVALGSVLAVKLVGALAWASTVIYKKYQEAKLVSEHVRAYEIENDQKELILDAQKKHIDILVEAEAQNLQESFLKEKNPEDLQRLKMSIETFSKLISKGVEVHPSIIAPEEVSNLFPDFKVLELIESKKKQLNTGNTEM